MEMERAANELPIEQVAKRWIVASDPDEAVEKVGEYVKYGLNHLVFHAPGHDQRRLPRAVRVGPGARLRKLASVRTRFRRDNNPPASPELPPRGLMAPLR